MLHFDGGAFMLNRYPGHSHSPNRLFNSTTSVLVTAPVAVSGYCADAACSACAPLLARAACARQAEVVPQAGCRPKQAGVVAAHPHPRGIPHPGDRADPRFPTESKTSRSACFAARPAPSAGSRPLKTAAGRPSRPPSARCSACKAASPPPHNAQRRSARGSRSWGRDNPRTAGSTTESAAQAA